MHFIDPVLDLFRGKAVTIPPMDGVLRPNSALEEAELVAEIEAPDNLCFDGQRTLFSSGNQVLALGSSGAEVLSGYGAPVAAMAARQGIRAMALDDGSIIIDEGERKRALRPPKGFACPTAIAFLDDRTLLVCHGSSLHRASDWVIDLMQKNASGALWKIDLDTGSQSCLAQGLAFPFGLLVTGEDIVFSEAWRHRLVRIAPGGGRTEIVLAKLPAYPARLTAAADGGAWLSMFAPRSRLVEFILMEDDYRSDMMRQIPRDHWIAPSLSANSGFLEPLQCGAVKTMGIHKPWAPSRSYGLVARLDGDMRPVASFHSRANGTRHGITSVIETKGEVLASAKGGNAILRIAAGQWHG